MLPKRKDTRLKLKNRIRPQLNGANDADGQRCRVHCFIFHIPMPPYTSNYVWKEAKLYNRPDKLLLFFSIFFSRIPFFLSIKQQRLVIPVIPFTLIFAQKIWHCKNPIFRLVINTTISCSAQRPPPIKSKAMAPTVPHTRSNCTSYWSFLSANAWLTFTQTASVSVICSDRSSFTRASKVSTVSKADGLLSGLTARPLSYISTLPGHQPESLPAALRQTDTPAHHNFQLHTAEELLQPFQTILHHRKCQKTII